jgi:hypothetical protein
LFFATQPLRVLSQKGTWKNLDVGTNKRQWWVIWIAVILGLFWSIALDGGAVGFGVPVLIGGLIVWQLQGRGVKNDPKN